MTESVEALIEQARANSRVEGLWQEISQKIPIKVIASDNKLWGSSTKPTGTTIEVAPAKWPAESLFHELLHTKLALDGYRRYLTVYPPTPDGHIALKILEILDNELQHFRMIDAFTSAGFDPKRFYADGDSNTLKKIRRAIEKEGATLDSWLLFSQFISVIAAGGVGTDKEKQQLKHYFGIKCPPERWKAMQVAEQALLSWQHNSSLDAAETIQAVLAVLRPNARIWFGATMDGFPGDGRFIGAPFTFQEAYEMVSGST